MGKAEMFVIILVWLYLCLYKCFKVESVKIILAVEKKNVIDAIREDQKEK